MTIRRRIYLILEPTEKGGILERIFEFLLVAIILLNILAIVCESIQEVREEYAHVFYRFEIFSVIFFTIEYFLRIYSIVENKKYTDPLTGRIKYIGTPMAIVDLMAFLPFYLSFLPLDLRFLRIFRLMGCSGCSRWLGTCTHSRCLKK
jgi:voltage-gated potassium channel